MSIGRSFFSMHGENDLGWKTSKGEKTAHFYKSNDTSKLGISHCGTIEWKIELVDDITAKHCKFCAMIEKLTASPYQSNNKDGDTDTE